MTEEERTEEIREKAEAVEERVEVREAEAAHKTGLDSRAGKGLMERRESFSQSSVPNAHRGYSSKMPRIMMGIIAGDVHRQLYPRGYNRLNNSPRPAVRYPVKAPRSPTTSSEIRYIRKVFSGRRACSTCSRSARSGRSHSPENRTKDDGLSMSARSFPSGEFIDVLHLPARSRARVAPPRKSKPCRFL